MAEVDNLLDTAFQAYNEKDFDYAEELARNVLTLSPTNGDGLYLLGLLASRMNAYEPAEKLLYQAVKLYPDQMSYKLSLAFVLEKQGRLDEALSFYEEFKDNAFVLAQVGFIYLQKGLFDFAQSAFDKSLSLNKEVLTAYIGNAHIYRKQNKQKEALAVLKEGLSHGQSAELFYQLAVSYRLLGQNGDALSMINQAINMDKVASFYNEKGLIFEALGRNLDALSSYEKAVSLNAYMPDAYTNLGNLYLKENNLRKAEDSYKRAIGIDNEFLQAHHNLALVLHKENRLTEALEHFRSAILIDSKHISSLYNLAVILEETGEYSEAAGLYFNLLLMNQNLPDIDFRISTVLTLLANQGKKEKKQAISFAKGWVKNFEDNPVALYTHASLTGEKIDQELAQKYSEKFYDAFAPSYDETMMKLESKTLDAIVQMIPDNGFEKVLDLACGTGTFALKLRQNINKLIGVDISSKMLEQAKNKNRYDFLYQKDILSFLDDTSEQYSLVLASDVTGYFKEIDIMLQKVYSVLEHSGIFIFSIEKTDEVKDVYLSPLGRYLYSPDFVKEQIKLAGFNLLDEVHLELRKEGSKTAMGVIYKCLKN